jgi:hypothetical protein
MKVRDLITQLQALPPDMPVYIYNGTAGHEKADAPKVVRLARLKTAAEFLPDRRPYFSEAWVKKKRGFAALVFRPRYRR